MKIVLHLYLFLLAFSQLNGEGIERYFKSCPDKSGNHQMPNIDFIYMINLDQRPEKYESCVRQLNPYGIYPYRFSAVNGKELPVDVINAVGVPYMPWMEGDCDGTYYLPEDEGKPTYGTIDTIGRTYFARSLSKGPIAIVLSHLSILQDAYDSGYETIWVMEDDIEVVRNPHFISSMIDKLDALVGKEGWDILFTDQQTKNKQGEYVPCFGYGWRPNFKPKNLKKLIQNCAIDEDFKTIGARYGAYSMIIRRSGMEKLLQFFKTYKIFLPYDMDFYLPPNINLFTVIDDIVSTQPNAITDNDTPAFGVESFPFKNEFDLLDEVGYEAFQAMNFLEGWCTQPKAANLINLISFLSPQTVVEIGVFGGKSLVPMAYALRAQGFGKAYGIDPWDSAESAKGLKGADLDWWMGLDMEEVLEGLTRKINEWDLRRYITLLRSTSQEAELIDNIDILNIDGNHSENCTFLDVVKWVPCVRKGGAIILNEHSNSAKAVKWLDRHCIKLAEVPGSTPCGIWVKP